MPHEFIPIAEETGLISELGNWVLRNAVEQLRRWRNSPETSRHNFDMRINGPRTCSGSNSSRTSGIHSPPRTSSRALLVLELTESDIIKGNELDRYTLASLRKLGVGLEIDDFGTGYSSISYLRRLPVDRVKVDRTLLTALGSDPAQPDLIAAILQLIRACGLEACVGGRRKRGAGRAPAEHRLHERAGLLLQPPLPAAEFTERLAWQDVWPG